MLHLWLQKMNEVLWAPPRQHTSAEYAHRTKAEPHTALCLGHALCKHTSRDAPLGDHSALPPVTSLPAPHVASCALAPRAETGPGHTQISSGPDQHTGPAVQTLTYQCRPTPHVASCTQQARSSRTLPIHDFTRAHQHCLGRFHPPRGEDLQPITPTLPPVVQHSAPHAQAVQPSR